MSALVVTAVAAGCVAALVVPGVGPPPPDRAPGERRWPFRRVPWTVLVAIGVWSAGAGTLAAAVAAAVTAAVRRGRRRAASERSRQGQEARAVEACGVLADELRAGRVPGEALASASEVDEALVPVRRVADAGGDVPTALRASGVRSYTVVAAAWQVAEQHGTGLGEALRRVLTQLRADRATARVVAAELASARSTAKLLVALPGFALLAGATSGGRPWEFLLGTPLGAGCLLAGLLLGWAGLRWIDAIAAGVTGRRR